MKSTPKINSIEIKVRKNLKRAATKTVLKKATPSSNKASIQTKVKLLKVKSANQNKLVKSKLSSINNEEIIVPSVASLRLLEKVQIYRLWYKNEFPQYMSTTAKVGGYVFILLGTLFTSGGYLVDKNFDQLSAAIVCSQEDCEEIKDENLPLGSPFVSFLNSIPNELSSDTDIDIGFENSPEVRVLIKDNQSGTLTLVNPIENITEKQRRYLIPVSQLPASSFQILAEVESVEKLFKFIGPTFTIPGKSLNEPTPANLTISHSTSDFVTGTATLPVEEETSISTTSPELSSEVEIEVPELSRDKISLTLKKSNNQNYLTITTGNLLPNKVEVYARLESTEDSLYLGQATFVQGEWTFSLSALDLPNVNFLLHASFVVNDEVYLSESALFTPLMQKTTRNLTNLESQILANKINLALETSDINIDKRSTYFNSLTSSSSEIFQELGEENYANKQVLDYINLIMNQDPLILDKLLLHYASAVAVGDEYLIDLTNIQFRKYIKAIVLDYLNSDKETTFATTLETVLNLRIQLLRAMVFENELKLKSVTNELTTKDSDGDGLSDLDEAYVYSTDPNTADSDFDTILDGIEIVTNTDPQKSDLIRLLGNEIELKANFLDDILVINSVDPLIAKDSSTNDEMVYAIVNGSSIPNTYVTVFIKQLNTVGIIKTNDKGDFSYTLEKPLADGAYEISAAFGDSNGNLAVSSKPYKFTKKSNNFLAAVVSKSHTYFEQDDRNSLLLASSITAATTLVTFGFILLLLGQIIRNRRESLEKTTV